MIDLTPSVESAYDRRESWNWQLAEARLRAFVANSSLTFDWDVGAGEDWARILRNARPVALLWTKIPFSFINATEFDLRHFLASLAMELVVLSDFDEPILSLDLTRAQSLIERERWPDAVRPSRMSASDLWWATV